MKETLLSRFTPSLMSPEALEAIFVQREALARRLVDLIRESALTDSKHHSLLIGPRGIGKTHLISIVYHRIRAQADLRDKLVIAWLREEEWGVATFLDLLLRVLRALEAEEPGPELAKRVASIHELPPDAAEHAAAQTLLEYLNGRTLLIIVENLDDIFHGLGDEGQQALRAYLQENPQFTILATAPSLFNGVSLRTSPFYGFFQIQHLQQVEIEEAAQLLTKIAELVGDRELASFVPTTTGRARVRTVYHLAGGNHRVFVIFSQFLTRDSLEEVVRPFLRTLDDLTPYYQERMRWLSPQQRKIVEFLCDTGHAVPVKEIARHCFITHQTATSQLKSLRDLGYVQSHEIGRESYHELREPLMRLCVEVKRNRGEPIRLFVDFLRLWYSRGELEQRLGLLPPEAALERAHVLQALEVSDKGSEDPRVAPCLEDFDRELDAGDFAGALRVTEELVAIRGDATDWIRQGYCLGELGHHEEELAAYDRAIELDPGDAGAWNNRGAALGRLGRHGEALAAFEKVIELGSWTSWARLKGAQCLLALERWNDAVALLDRALGDAVVPADTAAHVAEAAMRDILERVASRVTRRQRVEALLGIFRQHGQLAILAQGVVRSISALRLTDVGPEAAKSWRDVWQELAGDLLEFRIPLQLLDVAVRYLENADPRVLLELPIEHRRVLEPLLKGDEGKPE